MEARISVPAPVESLATGSDDGSAVPSTPHNSALVGGTFADEGIDDIGARRSPAFALDHFATAPKRRMGPVVAIPLGLGVGALVTGCTFHHGRQSSWGTFHPSVLTCFFSPVVNPLQTTRSVGIPTGLSRIMRRAFPFTGLIQRFGDTRADCRVAFSIAVRIAGGGVAAVGGLIGKVAGLGTVISRGSGNQILARGRSYGIPAAALPASEAETGGYVSESVHIGMGDGTAVITGVVCGVLGQGVFTLLFAGGSIEVPVVLHYPHHVRSRFIF